VLLWVLENVWGGTASTLAQFQGQVSFELKIAEILEVGAAAQGYIEEQRGN